MTKRLVIAGAGGFGRGVHGWVSSSPKFLQRHNISDIVFIDDEIPRFDLAAHLIGSIGEFHPVENDRVICAIGSSSVRFRIVDELKKRGAEFISFVDDRAVLGPKVEIGGGTIICPGVVVSAGSSIGNQAHLNFNCSIGHDTQIGPFCILSPSVNLMGEIKIGPSVFFGGSSTVLPRLQIGESAQIGAGSVVTKNIPGNVVAKGVPARWIKS